MFAPAAPLALSGSQKREIESLVRDGATPQKIALRGRIVLLSHQGLANYAIAQRLGVSRPMILFTAFGVRRKRCRRHHGRAEAQAPGEGIDS